MGLNSTRLRGIHERSERMAGEARERNPVGGKSRITAHTGRRSESHIRRRLLVAVSLAAAGTLLAACSGSTQSGSKTYHITFGSPNPRTAADTQALLKWADAVKSDTNGAVVIKEYPNDQLGTDATQMTAVRNGSQQGFAGSLADLENYTKVIAPFDLPYTFPNGESDAKKILFGPTGDKITKAVEPSGFEILGWLDIGPRQLISKVPVSTPEQMKGVKIRVQQSPVPEKMWKAVGGDINPIAFSDVYTALQTNVVSAVSDPINSIYEQKFNEQTKYLTQIHAVLTVNPIVLSKKFWDTLPKKYQQIVKNDAVTATKSQWQDEIHEAEENLSKMKASGIKVLPIDTSQWQQAWKPFVTSYLRTLPASAQALYKEITASESAGTSE